MSKVDVIKLCGYPQEVSSNRYIYHFTLHDPATPLGNCRLYNSFEVVFDNNDRCSYIKQIEPKENF
jgi:hypothetical protein